MSEELNTIYDESARCNKCGFCQAVCPIFDITKDERSVARGHNSLVRRLIEGDLELDEEFKDPLYECLLCKACVENCFPGVLTNQIVVKGRSEYMRQVGEPKMMPFLFHKLLPDQKKMAKYIRFLAFGKNAGMSKMARALGILKWFRRDLDKAENIVETMPTRFFRDRVPSMRLSADKPRVKIAYFVGCGFNFVLPHCSEATLDVLVKNGAAVTVPEHGCCGLPAYVYGDLEAARSMAKKNIQVFEAVDADLILTECASCSSFLKEYPEVLEGEPAWRERAEKLIQRVRGFSEYLHDSLSECAPTSGQQELTVTYHDPCHMCRYQELKKEPRALLKKLPGVDFVELPEADRCCGAAGSYNILHYDQSMKILDRKMDNLQKTKARVLTTECPSCCIQLGYGVRRAGLPTRVVHISELVRERCYGIEE